MQARQLVPAIIKAEMTNVPRMIKELVIQANPGIVLAFVCVLLAVSVGGVRYATGVQRSLPIIVTLAAGALILAYSMLVVDTRYLFPLAPLVIAVGARFLWPEEGVGSTRLSQVCWLFLIGGIVWSLTYSSSPLRIQTRDFQQICYWVGTVLKQSDAKTLVSIGRGPFPEHGVGWEAGYKSAYFAHNRLIATAEAVPAAGDFGAILTDISSALPDAILVWNSDDTNRGEFIAALNSYQYAEHAKIYDPVLGDVGVVLLRNQGNATTH